MPKRRAVSATVSKPTRCASRTATVLIDRANASRTVTVPAKPGVKFFGDQPSMVIGASTMVSSGWTPFSIAAT